MIAVRGKIKLLVAVLLMGGGAVFAAANHTVETNEQEWTINHSDKGQEFNLRINAS